MDITPDGKRRGRSRSSVWRAADGVAVCSRRYAVVPFVRRPIPLPAAWLALAAAVAVTDRDYAITASCLALIQPGSQAT
jgi:hypothetical protein